MERSSKAIYERATSPVTNVVVELELYGERSKSNNGRARNTYYAAGCDECWYFPYVLCSIIRVWYLHLRWPRDEAGLLV